MFFIILFMSFGFKYSEKKFSFKTTPMSSFIFLSYFFTFNPNILISPVLFVKFKIDFAEREIAFTLFGIPFGGMLEGSVDNPKITIFNLRTEETYAQFTYWGENYLHFVWDAGDDDREENLIIHGEFTSK